MTRPSDPARCPFCASPQFVVNDKRRLFKCFSCGASGDAIAFVMRTQGLTFADASRVVATHPPF